MSIPHDIYERNRENDESSRRNTNSTDSARNAYGHYQEKFSIQFSQRAKNFFKLYSAKVKENIVMDLMIHFNNCTSEQWFEMAASKQPLFLSFDSYRGLLEDLVIIFIVNYKPEEYLVEIDRIKAAPGHSKYVPIQRDGLGRQIRDLADGLAKKAEISDQDQHTFSQQAEYFIQSLYSGKYTDDLKALFTVAVHVRPFKNYGSTIQKNLIAADEIYRITFKKNRQIYTICSIHKVTDSYAKRKVQKGWIYFSHGMEHRLFREHQFSQIVIAELFDELWSSLSLAEHKNTIAIVRTSRFKVFYQSSGNKILITWLKRLH